MTEYPEKLQALLEAYQMLEDRQDRIDSLINVADRFEPVPERIATKPYSQENLVPHCESSAYVFFEEQPDGTLKYYFAIENPQGISAMAMAVILDDTLSGQPLERVAKVQPEIVYTFFGNELSMGKSMGLMAMVQMVRQTAIRRLAESIVRE